MASILDSIFSRANPVPRSGLGYGILAPGATLPQQTAQPLAPATPVTPRDKVIQAARQAGTFDTLRQKYNQEALAMGSMTEMDEAGNIVQREPSEYEAYLNAGRLTGGNTYMPTSSPLQRAMQMEAQRQITNENARNAVQAEKMMADQRAQERADAEKARRYEAGVRTVAPGVETLFGKYGRGFVAPAGTVPSNMQAVLQKAREEEAMGNVSDADLALMAAGKMAPPISSETVVPAIDFDKSLASAMTRAWEIERNKKMAEAEKKENGTTSPAPAAQPAKPQPYTGINDTPGAASSRLSEMILKQAKQSKTTPPPAGSLAASSADKERRASIAALRPASQLVYDTTANEFGGTPMSPLQFAMTNLYPGDDEKVLAEKYGINVGSQAGLIPAAADILNQMQPRIKEEQNARQAKAQTHWEKQLSTLSPQAMEIVKRVASGGQQGKTMSESEFNATNFLPGLDTLGFKTVFGGMPSNMTDYATIQALADAYKRVNTATQKK